MTFVKPDYINSSGPSLYTFKCKLRKTCHIRDFTQFFIQKKVMLILSRNIYNDCLTEPLRWKGAHDIFVCSMSDIFHEDVPFEFVDRIYGISGDSERSSADREGRA